MVGEAKAISLAEVKRLMRLVNMEALKMRLGVDGKEVISYCELLEACESIGVARSFEEAAAFAWILDEAGVILLFRDKVYLHPDKVVYLVRKAECLYVQVYLIISIPLPRVFHLSQVAL
ncbi:hypothetical protein UlMin_019769 [Ulmus minor]